MGNLLKLIQSLTSAEKRYLKTHCDNSAKYMILFDFINKNETSTLSTLRAKGLPNEIVRQFPALKYYLGERILSTLKNYHKESDSYLEIQDLLGDVRILLKKKLVEQAEKRLRKAKKLASKFGFDEVMLKLLYLERSIIRNYTQNKSVALLKTVQEETMSYMSRLEAKRQITDVYDKLFLATRNKVARTANTDGIVKEFQDLKVVKESDLSFETYMTQQLLHVTYHQLFTDRKDLVLQNVKNLIEHFDKNKHWKKEYALRYVNLLNIYLNAYYLQGNFVKIKSLITKFNDVVVSTSADKIAVEQTKFHWQLLHSIRAQELEKAESLVPVIEKWLEANKGRVSPQYELILRQNFVLVYFYLRDHKKVQTYFEKVNKVTKRDVRQDVPLFCRLVLLMSSFEENDYDLTEQTIRSLTRIKDVKTKSSMTSFVKKIVHLINEGFKENYKFPKGAAQQLRHELESDTAYLNGKDDVILWLKKYE